MSVRWLHASELQILQQLLGGEKYDFDLVSESKGLIKDLRSLYRRLSTMLCKHMIAEARPHTSPPMIGSRKRHRRYYITEQGRKLYIAHHINAKTLPRGSMITLEKFIQSGERRSQPVFVEHFEWFYVRYGARYINDQKVFPVLTLANIVAEKPGNGAFTTLLTQLIEQYPYIRIFAECVHDPRFRAFLVRHGFLLTDNGESLIR